MLSKTLMGATSTGPKVIGISSANSGGSTATSWNNTLPSGSAVGDWIVTVYTMDPPFQSGDVYTLTFSSGPVYSVGSTGTVTYSGGAVSANVLYVGVNPNPTDNLATVVIVHQLAAADISANSVAFSYSASSRAIAGITYICTIRNSVRPSFVSLTTASATTTTAIPAYTPVRSTDALFAVAVLDDQGSTATVSSWLFNSSYPLPAFSLFQTLQSSFGTGVVSTIAYAGAMKLNSVTAVPQSTVTWSVADGTLGFLVAASAP
jgi:hypothetical protein